MDANLLRFNPGAKYCFLDLESFNLMLGFAHNRFWQCGIITTVDERTIEEKDLRLKWNTHLKIGEEAAKVTRYNPKEQERLQKPAEEMFPIVDKDLRECDWLVMHNGLGFDVYLLIEWYKMMGVDFKFFLSKILDTSALARGIKLNIPYRKDQQTLLEYQYKLYHKRVKGVKTNLTALGKEYGIDFCVEDLHQAINDLRLNKSVWEKMKYQVEI